MSLTINIMSYLYGHLASQCIESIISQSVKPDVIRFYDDGGFDCRELKNKYPIEFIFRDENWGIIENFNDALYKTETDRVMFIGADNYLRPDTLEILEPNLNYDIISYDILLFGELAGQFAGNWNLTEKQWGYWIWKFQKGNISVSNYIHGSSIYNTKLAKDLGGYHRRGIQRTEEDWALFEKMLMSGASHFHVPESLLFYRRHKNNFHRY